MAVSFYIDNRTDKNGDVAIRVSIAIRGSRLVTSSGLKATPSKWSRERQRMKQGSSNALGHTYNEINAMLSRIEDYFNKYESRCITENIRPSTEDLRCELARNFLRNRRATAPNAKMTMWDVYALFTKEMGSANQWTRATFQKFATLENHLRGFDCKLDFADLTEFGLNAFVAYLRDEKELVNSTIGKQLGFLRWFLRWAAAKGYNTNMAFQTFSPKLKTTERKVIFLEWPELMRVLNYEIPANGTIVPLKDADGNAYEKTMHDASAIAKTRDIFCFCCFTSLRYSDASNLKWSNIIGEKITITTIKTADTITIELNKYALAILDKYRAEANSGAFVFPHMTNQRMNIYLKDLCEFVGINQPITQTYYHGSERIDETRPKFELVGTHCGRRTFICNALMLGIPAEIVMKWTGHSGYSSMKPYIAIADAAKAKAMDLFNKL